MRKCTIRVVKTKALISFAVTAKLICVFVFIYADCWFSHEAAHLLPNFAMISCRLLSLHYENKLMQYTEIFKVVKNNNFQ